MKPYAKLVYIDGDRAITPEQDAQFLYELQQALFLALKECGTLTEAQYQYGSEKLKKQAGNQPHLLAEGNRP